MQQKQRDFIKERDATAALRHTTVELILEHLLLRHDERFESILEESEPSGELNQEQVDEIERLITGMIASFQLMRSEAVDLLEEVLNFDGTFEELKKRQFEIRNRLRALQQAPGFSCD